jgi:hypothetical protein
MQLASAGVLKQTWNIACSALQLTSVQATRREQCCDVMVKQCMKKEHKIHG